MQSIQSAGSEMKGKREVIGRKRTMAEKEMRDEREREQVEREKKL